ncbi:conserved Plasmodium protein, unknown function [Plasmodium berghei]|uniref:Uncharacterized protein n=2 Tax=Plasmodium berghei TaxID=5821 RepID=A0A509AIF9_PLABA|nr:conserved protein, unknown function [Plasmodium berghei ANKA]CXI10642.1 conserved Plasmodium protein, unknown function [Plasmodium berghei]SCL93052.1 conserved Plasmodium protein, unknown function [Plasmodium berghei]SCM15779.1 conserved Plasmodium protein, unknown function [Plasmodium berghei]SCM17574.1 conserved Plasmodium protein, unknown function [Plasmodium berghei]SCN23037.1 conserved Plasmodium protein, unknown function [Plasmodium berghei]|eukprot:XP_034420385.1 conserved protein, unknown function [Plasmodium berghei ANKA]
MKKEKASHPEESNVPDQMSLKRDKKQIEALVYSLKRNIHEYEELKNRAEYFFFTDNLLHQTLFNLCKFIPNDKDILNTEKNIKNYNSEICLEFINSDTNSWSNQTMIDDITLNENKESNKSNTPFCNIREKEKKNTCVEWLGFINEANGYAATKICSPFVSHEYYTYANRIVYFLFQKTNYLKIEDFLNNHNFINKIIPMYMKCKNKLCVKLSHINGSNDLYL